MVCRINTADENINTSSTSARREKCKGRMSTAFSPKFFYISLWIFEQSVRTVGSVNSLGLFIPMSGTSGKKGFANYTGEIRAVTMSP